MLRRFGWTARVTALRLLQGRNVVRSPARRWLERSLFYDLRRENDPDKVLFIGVAAYTAWYHKLFKAGALESIDVNESAARYGSPHRHVVGSATELPRYWPAAYFDVVVCNGVYGWGLDGEDELRRALYGIRHVLRADGLLVFGFNEDAELDPLHLLAHRERYFADFDDASLAGASVVRFERARRHTYLSFRPRQP